MKSIVETSTRNLIIAVCGFLGAAIIFVPPAFAQLQGGPFTLHPTTTAGGGGTSTGGSTRLEGSIGQSILGMSNTASFALESGFWPNADPCPIAVLPTGQFFTSTGGAGSATVIAPAYCSWNATASENWIVITSADSGAGNEVVTYETRENFTGSARQATITINGLRQVVVQDAGLGEDCNDAINPAFQSFSASGGTGTLNVIAEERCAWQAIASESWITITSIGVGIGNGLVSYRVGANASPSGRNGFIFIAGQAFTIKQKRN